MFDPLSQNHLGYLGSVSIGPGTSFSQNHLGYLVILAVIAKRKTYPHKPGKQKLNEDDEIIAIIVAFMETID